MALAPDPLFRRPDGKPVKPPRRHAYLGGRTLDEYMALSHAEQLRVDAEAAKAAGLVYEMHYHETSGKPYWVGKKKSTN